MIDRFRSALRVVARMPQGRIGERICFVHVPKCGGSALRSALSDAYGLRGRLPGHRVYISPSRAKRVAELTGTTRRTADRTLLGYALLDDRAEYVAGHVEYPHDLAEGVEHETERPWRYVTVLREPVAKWFSQYFYNREKSSEHGRVHLPLEAFLETESARGYGSDYVRFFGPDNPPGPHDEAQMERAVETLATFAVVGVLESTPRFLDDFEARFGVRLDIPVVNTNPVAKTRQRDEISDDVRAEVERLCAPNRYVYRRIRQTLGLAETDDGTIGATAPGPREPAAATSSTARG